MKKFKFTWMEAGVLTGLLLFCGVVFAATWGQQFITATTLTNATLNASGSVYVGDADKSTFYIVNTPINGTVQLNVSVQGSYDNSTWHTMTFYEPTTGANLYNGTVYSMPIASKTLGANASGYLFWMEPLAVLPYAKVTIASNASATQTTNVSVSVFKLMK